MRLIFFVGLLLLGCSKKPKHPPNATVMPPPFDFVLADNSDNALIINETQNIQLWYELNGQKNYLSDLKIKPIIGSIKYSYYATSVFTPLKSSDNISKYFYLQIDNTKIDTVYLDVVRLSQPVEREYNQYKEVRFNGKIITLDKNHQPGLFFLKRD